MSLQLAAEGIVWIAIELVALLLEGLRLLDVVGNQARGRLVLWFGHSGGNRRSVRAQRTTELGNRELNVLERVEAVVVEWKELQALEKK